MMLNKIKEHKNTDNIVTGQKKRGRTLYVRISLSRQKD